MQAAEHGFGDDTVAGADLMAASDSAIAASGSNFSQADAGHPLCPTIPFVRNASPR